MRMKLGKRAPKRDPRTLMLASYLGHDLPAAPESVSWSDKMGPLGMCLNDTIGDCTAAGCAHLIQSWTGNASGTPKIISDHDVLAAYVAVSGYVPGDPSTDNGCIEIDVLNYWRNTGIAGDKITAYAALQPGSITELRDAVWMFGGCYLGLALPLTCQNQDVWAVPPGGPKWDAEKGSLGGHCVPAIAYTPRAIAVITWGAVKYMTYEFYKTYADEAYAVISQDWLGVNQLTPSNFNLAQLEEDLNIVTQL